MEKIVFTNGCFDILHPGHVDLLSRARALGTKLIVGINSDRSVRSIKGESRPYVAENDRAAVLLGLAAVDEVRIFDEPTPEKLIKEIKPNILVKGGDWKIGEIIGADFVTANGGEVYSLPLKDSYSSTGIIEKIRNEKELERLGALSETTSRASESNAEISLTDGYLKNSIGVMSKLLDENAALIDKCGEIILETLARGNKVLIYSDNDNKSDVKSLVSKLSEAYVSNKSDKPGLNNLQIISLISDAIESKNESTTDSENFTAIQIDNLANENDLLIAVSTEGNSTEIASAVMKARAKNCRTMGTTGKTGKKLASLCDNCLIISSDKPEDFAVAADTISNIWSVIIASK